MKIFFAGSIRGGRDDQSVYAEIIATLSKQGDVLTEHIGDKNLSQMGEVGDTPSIHAREMGRLEDADVLIAEVTTASLGVGYEIAKAENMGKKILCLYRSIEGKSISAMISGSDQLTLKEYKDLENFKEIVNEFLTTK